MSKETKEVVSELLVLVAEKDQEIAHHRSMRGYHSECREALKDATGIISLLLKGTTNSTLDIKVSEIRLKSANLNTRFHNHIVDRMTVGQLLWVLADNPQLIGLNKLNAFDGANWDMRYFPNIGKKTMSELAESLQQIDERFRPNLKISEFAELLLTKKS